MESNYIVIYNIVIYNITGVSYVLQQERTPSQVMFAKEDVWARTFPRFRMRTDRNAHADIRTCGHSECAHRVGCGVLRAVDRCLKHLASLPAKQLITKIESPAPTYLPTYFTYLSHLPWPTYLSTYLPSPTNLTPGGASGPPRLPNRS